MKKDNKKSLLLGIFVISGLIIFTLGIYFIGAKQNLFGNSNKINAVFSNVDGLQEGNNVRFSGVNVGTVRKVRFIRDTAILVEMIVDHKTFQLIKKNSLATISSDGLVGSMIVNILPGEVGSSRPVEPGDTIKSLSRNTSMDMLNTLSTINEKVALLTSDLLKITRSINEGEGLIGQLLNNEEIAIEIKESITNFRNSSRAAFNTISGFEQILSEINFKESTAGVLLSDTASAEKITEVISSLEQSSEEINKTTSNFNEFSKNIKEGKGALNYITQDTSLVNELDSAIQNMEEASANFKEITKAIKSSFLFRGYFRRLEHRQQKEKSEED